MNLQSQVEQRNRNIIYSVNLQLNLNTQCQLTQNTQQKTSSIQQKTKIMFTQDILTLENKYTNNNNLPYTSNNNQSSAELDLQYQIYAKYIQLSKQQFAFKEISIINDTQNLLQNLNLSTKLDTSKDVSTIESFSYDQDLDNSLSQQLSSISKLTPKKITRKGARHSVLKPSTRSKDDFQQILNDIERNCTEHTLSVVKSLLQQHKKNVNKMIEIQKKQKTIRRIEQKTEKVEQENIILKAKLTEIEEKIKSKDEQIKSIKEKLSQFKVTQKENKKSAQKMTLSLKNICEQESTTICSSQSNKNNFLKQYIDTKELGIIQKMNKIKKIQTKIQTLIQEVVLGKNQQGCSKCCQIIKKIKQTVFKYRTYLEEESEECQKMYDMLKAQVENTLQNKNMPNLNVFIPINQQLTYL